MPVFQILILDPANRSRCENALNDDLTRGTALAEEIIGIITDADQSTEKLEITQGEREARQEQVIAKMDDAASLPPQSDEGISLRKEITEDEFLKELRNQESFYKQEPGGFVGLTRLLRFHLAELGYDEKSARLVTERPKKSSNIEVHYVENPYSFGTTAALRSVADSTRVLGDAVQQGSQ